MILENMKYSLDPINFTAKKWKGFEKFNMIFCCNPKISLSLIWGLRRKQMDFIIYDYIFQEETKNNGGYVSVYHPFMTRSWKIHWE